MANVIAAKGDGHQTGRVGGENHRQGDAMISDDISALRGQNSLAGDQILLGSQRGREAAAAGEKV
jgi:hypothetical protein